MHCLHILALDDKIKVTAMEHCLRARENTKRLSQLQSCSRNQNSHAPNACWCRIKVDASFRDGKAGFAVAFQDHQSQVVFPLETAKVNAQSAPEAELLEFELGLNRASRLQSRFRRQTDFAYSRLKRRTPLPPHLIGPAGLVFIMLFNCLKTFRFIHVIWIL